VAAALAVYDMVQTLGSPISTLCLGSLTGPAVAVLTGGSAGRRYALPHSRIQLSDAAFDPPSAGQGDVTVRAAEAQRQRTRWLECVARHSAHSVAHIGKDLASGRWLSAAEARDYGLVDGIIPGVPQT
jgi:ATP-dependent Clp protease protease subunit